MEKSYSPGDIVEVCLIQAGRIRNQGVGYLNDNAVILVKNGEPFINKSIEVEITKVFQTSRQYNIVLAQPTHLYGANILRNQL